MLLWTKQLSKVLLCSVIHIIYYLTGIRNGRIFAHLPEQSMLEQIPNNGQQLSVFVNTLNIWQNYVSGNCNSIVALLFWIRNLDVLCFTIVLQIRTSVVVSYMKAFFNEQTYSDRTTNTKQQLLCSLHAVYRSVILPNKQQFGWSLSQNSNKMSDGRMLQQQSYLTLCWHFSY